MVTERNENENEDRSPSPLEPLEGTHFLQMEEKDTDVRPFFVQFQTGFERRQ
jgi:hypothetical protein